MKEVQVPNRNQWRKWLAANHDQEKQGIWLVFYKLGTGKATLLYEEAIEEALCFGWIDSVVRKIDAQRYCRKFTPRRTQSCWSEINRRRAEKVIREGRMTELGLAKVQAAKRSGRWKADPRPALNLELAGDLKTALANNHKASARFEALAPSHQKRFIAWIVTAKRPETRAKRIRESLASLAQGERLGLK